MAKVGYMVESGLDYRLTATLWQRTSVTVDASGAELGQQSSGSSITE